MKKLIFDTKENNNKRREDEFLALCPAEWVVQFLKLVDQYRGFPSSTPTERKMI